MGISAGTPLAFFVNDKDATITMELYQPGCIFCNAVGDDLLLLLGKPVCQKCYVECVNQYSS